MSEENLVHVSDQDFEKTIKEAQKPVLVDFYADWCGPCQMVAPVMEELAEEYSDKVVVAKMNIDENRETPTNFGIMSIPTVMLFVWEDEKVVLKAKKVGFTGKDVYVKMIEDILS
jgi:thioredoxin 1